MLLSEKLDKSLIGMNKAYCVLFFVLVAGCLSSNVVDLTPDNFDTVVDGSKAVFVEFFAPWCGHCKKLAPEYEIVADAFVREAGVVIAKVDADAHKSLASRFGVTGYPTLKFFPKGYRKGDEPTAYSGGRTADDIVSYVNSESGSRARIAKPATAVEVLTPETFDSIVLDGSKDVFVEFYAPWCGHCKKLAPTWEQLAGVFDNEENVVIANLDADAHKEIAGRFGVTGFPTLIFFSKDNKEGEKYNGGRELSDLLAHVNTAAGTLRQEDGTLSSQAGLNEELNALAATFVQNADTRTATQEKAEAVVAGLSEAEAKSAVFYVKYMKVIQKRGDDWVAKESERLVRLLSDNSVSSSKIDEFTVRQNILNVFQ
eukprot:TRINITY_DN75_c0_g1_i1.p1 TRINITY_DN75_c0_g1~~TRINITY_DN75_c0_g1_i1.p1  ORF type:complete len:371 (+),score=111.93 TRINITY_DN75_c0_g1_i1:1-1113(+)